MRLSLFLPLAISSTLAFAQASPPPRIAVERQANVTNHRVEGSLAPTQRPGCIPLAKATNTLTPPDLYAGARECIDQDRFELAVDLFAVAGMYSRFDAERVADKSAGQARTVLVMSLFSSVPDAKKRKFQEMSGRVMKDPQSVRRLCDGVRKLGAPGYFPKYMVLHGMGAFSGSKSDDALVKNFDSQKAWRDLQNAYLHCPA